MAEQTIIVMSDSHGERDIVVDIKIVIREGRCYFPQRRF